MRRTPASERSRLGPYFRDSVSVLPTSASATAEPLMYPCSSRILAMFALSFEWGMDTEVWYAMLALRSRVSMSAIGSVIVMSESLFLIVVSRRTCGVVVYQLLLVMPGSSPRCAISRKQIRHRPNLRYTECGRPHFWHLSLIHISEPT